MTKTELTLDDCYFYSTIDLPGHGEQLGEWDLRGNESEYFGGFDFNYKSVLEIGTANGALAFWMEKQGAEVTGYDLSPDYDWDIVPRGDDEEIRKARKSHIGRLNNAFRYSRQLLGSHVALAHGTVYNLPFYTNDWEVVTMASILLHVQNPLGAIIEAARVCRETLIITDVFPGHTTAEKHAQYWQGAPIALFAPAIYKGCWDAWFHLSPEIVSCLLRRLGFGMQEMTTHTHTYSGKETALWTIVGRRN